MAKWNNIKIRKYILYKPQLKKEKIMSKKAREQLIALLTLSSVFIFFIYLKMNPEISATLLSSEPQIDKIIEEQIEFVEKKQLSEIEKEEIITLEKLMPFIIEMPVAVECLIIKTGFEDYRNKNNHKKRIGCYKHIEPRPHACTNKIFHGKIKKHQFPILGFSIFSSCTICPSSK